MLTELKNRTIVLHVLSWVIVFSLIGLLFFLNNNNIIVKFGLGVVLFYLNFYFLIPKYLFQRKFVAYGIMAGVFVIFLAAIYTYIKAIYFVEDERSNISSLTFTSFFYVIVLLFGVAIKIFIQWNQEEKQKLEIASKKATSELQNLKNQINPHFLFNSLNSIYSLTLQNSEKSPDAVMMLSDLMRYMLYETDSDEVLLVKEIEYLENFVKLQKLQIANSDGIQLNVNGKIHSQKISPLILISFIENAFKYGTDFSGKTKIIIDIYVKDNELQFRCENIIGNRTEAANKEYGGIGIKNTKERLKLSYPETHWLRIDEQKDTYVVKLSIKLND